MKLKNEIRLNNLRMLIDEAGSQVDLANRLSISPNYINTLIKQRIDATTGKPKNIGEALARKLEKAMDKPLGWLDQDHDTDKPSSGYIELIQYDVESSAGNGSIAPDEYTPILDKLFVLEDWALQHFGKGADKKIQIITNKGDSMSPTINDGDILFVDITQRHFVGDGIYILNWHGRLLTKRLKALIDGRLAIISDNGQFYETEYVTAQNIENLFVCGVVKKWWCLKG